MRTVIQSFALGLLTATVIVGVVFLLDHSKSNESVEKNALTEESAYDFLTNRGYSIVLSSDYDQIKSENESLKLELISLEEEIKEKERINEQLTEDHEGDLNEETEIDVFEDENENERHYTLTISPGMNSISISNLLYYEGLVDDASQFNQFLELNGYSRRIQLGTFELTTNMDYEQIANIITN